MPPKACHLQSIRNAKKQIQRQKRKIQYNSMATANDAGYPQHCIEWRYLSTAVSSPKRNKAKNRHKGSQRQTPVRTTQIRCSAPSGLVKALNEDWAKWWENRSSSGVRHRWLRCVAVFCCLAAVALCCRPVPYGRGFPLLYPTVPLLPTKSTFSHRLWTDNVDSFLLKTQTLTKTCGAQPLKSSLGRGGGGGGCFGMWAISLGLFAIRTQQVWQLVDLSAQFIASAQ